MARVDLWKPVLGFEGHYEVSSSGEVKSVDRIRPDGRRQRERLLRQTSFQNGRRKVTLTKFGVQTTHRVHCLVAEAFFGSRPEGMNVCHRNGDPADNRVENLYYGTQSENIRDAVRHGTHHWASKTRCPQGHEYNEENTLVYNGRRNCRSCRNESKRRRRAMKREVLTGG